ncbi:MAG: hypothetical protein V1712_01810 [Patescibacteria group bacterium]
MFSGLWGQKTKFWATALIILTVLAVFFWLQSTPTLADPDSFYHTKITLMIRDYGLPHNFPWMQNSLYKELYIDHHFLYHVLLIPFISLVVNPLVGIKLATVFFATFSILTIIWLLYKEKAKWLWLWLLLLLTSSPLLFRLSLSKAPSLAIGVTIIGLYIISRKKPIWLLVWSWLFVWFYSAWPLMILMLLIYTTVEAIYDSYDKIKQTGATVYNFLNLIFQSWWSKQNRLLFLAGLVGIIAGLVINPYFPTNLFYLKQLFTMSLSSYNKFIGIGNEWYPWPITYFIEYISLQLLVWIISSIFFFLNLKKQTKFSWTAWFLTLIFFGYTLKARRQVEYLLPMMIISSALSWRDITPAKAVKNWWRKFITWLPNFLQNKTFVIFIIIYLSIIIPVAVIKNLTGTHQQLANGFSLDHLQAASNWLEANSEAGSIVFQSDWGTFPLLFYNNTHNYYLTGLDQTFMYEYDKDKYQLWRDTVDGKRSDLYEIIHNDFSASWLLLEKKRLTMLKWVNRNERFKKVFDDEDAIIFKLAD